MFCKTYQLVIDCKVSMRMIALCTCMKHNYLNALKLNTFLLVNVACQVPYFHVTKLANFCHKNNNKLLYFYLIIVTYVHAITNCTLTKCMPIVNIFFFSLMSLCNHQCMNCLMSMD